ncbi:metalloregulator ArsR/SmtB family transcription factor [Sphingobium sp. WTD-1]|uniref:ArsR/SmtB family transcription factor n=1 Tax=Sphingobium sp. WTD-1 TaxID=2979467 RepID=UPI0024DE913F|nr:metalloregulator ArsR/SmtB family transcription factor [Sphingobium sp. WTD-1]WIA54692.1 metalloregulator ArsR/SmtB family transcription factor [Sphingobium sp. WTD-1]
MSPAEIFAALGDPTRLSLIARLGDGNGRSIVQLGEGLPISRQAVAKHLEVLHGAGLVRRHRQGREVHFALRREAVATAQDWLGRVGAQWDGTLARLKAFAEGDDPPPSP